jgi:hypothetical protein
VASLVTVSTGFWQRQRLCGAVWQQRRENGSTAVPRWKQGISPAQRGHGRQSMSMPLRWESAVSKLMSPGISATCSSGCGSRVLGTPQRGVGPVLKQKRFVRPSLGNSPLVEDDDLVGMYYSGKAMCDY